MRSELEAVYLDTAPTLLACQPGAGGARLLGGR
jgi:hypothetical protein